jgi:hypothetical protein
MTMETTETSQSSSLTSAMTACDITDLCLSAVMLAILYTVWGAIKQLADAYVAFILLKAVYNAYIELHATDSAKVPKPGESFLDLLKSHLNPKDQLEQAFKRFD